MLQASSFQEALATFMLSAVYLPLFALVVVGMFAPGYALVFVCWPWLVGWLPYLERRRPGLLLAAIVLALPAALVVAHSRAYFGFAIRWGVFAQWFTMATVTGSIAILAPRLFWRALAPGAFCKEAA